MYVAISEVILINHLPPSLAITSICRNAIIASWFCAVVPRRSFTLGCSSPLAHLTCWPQTLSDKRVCRSTVNQTAHLQSFFLVIWASHTLKFSVDSQFYQRVSASLDRVFVSLANTSQLRRFLSASYEEIMILLHSHDLKPLWEAIESVLRRGHFLCIFIAFLADTYKLPKLSSF